MNHLTAIYTRTHSVGAVLIRAGAWWGPASHCGIVDGDRVIECLALPPLDQVDGSWRRKLRGEIVSTPLARVIERSSWHEIVQINCQRPDLGLEWARSTVGWGYDHGGVIAIPFRQRDWQAPGLGYCSEHLEAALVRSGAQRWRPGLHGISPCQSYFNAGGVA